MPPLQEHHVHALSCEWGESWNNFFSKKYFNRKFPIFFKKENISFPFFFQILLRILLVLHFESSSNSFSFLYNLNSLPICHPYTHFFIYIKGTIVEKPDLNFFRKLFWFLGVLWPNLRNLIWSLSFYFF